LHCLNILKSNLNIFKKEQSKFLNFKNNNTLQNFKMII